MIEILIDWDYYIQRAYFFVYSIFQLQRKRKSKRKNIVEN